MQDFPHQDYSEVVPGEIDSMLEEAEESLNEGLEVEYKSRIVDDSFVDFFVNDLDRRGAAARESSGESERTGAQKRKYMEQTSNVIADFFSTQNEDNEINPVRKNGRIEYREGKTSIQELEDTLSATPSNVGSSAMHDVQVLQAIAAPLQGNAIPPVLEHSSSLYLEGAIEQFYDVAYRRFAMATPSFASTSATGTTGCLGKPGNPTNNTDGLFLSKREVSDLLLKQLKRGKDISDKRFVESFANSMLQQMQYSCLCPSCETFFLQ